MPLHYQPPAVSPVAAVLSDQPQIWLQLEPDQMNLAASDAAPKAAPNLTCSEENILKEGNLKSKQQSGDFDLFLLDFIKLELCADQTVRELAHLSLMLAADRT